MKGVRYIYLFRHGETYFNRDGFFTGWKDSLLTPRGVKDAKMISEKLKNKKFHIAFQSPLKRSKQTLKIVLKNHPECKVVLEDERIIERSYGILEGTSHNSFIKSAGRQILKELNKGGLYTHLDSGKQKELIYFFGKHEYDAVHRNYDLRPLGGESFADVEKRVGSFIKDLLKIIRKLKVNVAISAHGNSIRCFRKIMENKSKEEAEKWEIPFDRYFVYKVKL